MLGSSRPPTLFELRRGQKSESKSVLSSPTRKLLEEKLSKLGAPLVVPMEQLAVDFSPMKESEVNFSTSSYGPERHVSKRSDRSRESKKIFGLTGEIRKKYSQPEIALPPHLRGNLDEREDLLRRVNLELQRCCGTTREELQKKINNCKVATKPCTAIHDDSKLTTQQKLLLYSKGMVEFQLCRNYRQMMNRAFAAESDFKDYWQSQAHENHLLNEAAWKEEKEKCRRFRTQAMTYMEARRQVGTTP